MIQALALIDITRNERSELLRFQAHRGYRYLGQVYMLYKMRRKYLKFKLT
jgi:hypothetical protein